MILSAERYCLREDAPWVVLVHGAGGSSVLWYRQLRPLRARFNIMLVDLRGHRGSAEASRGLPASDYTFRVVASDVIETLDHHSIAAAHFVGLSLGSTIVRVIADGWPERVRAMVLGGAIVRMNLRARWLLRLGYATRGFVPYMWLYRFFAWVVMPGPQHRVTRMLFAREARALGQREFVRWFRLAREVRALLERLAAEPPPVPALYLTGDEDYMFLPAVRRMMAGHAQARLQVLGKSGHVCNLEQPDLFNAATLAFLDAQSPVVNAPAEALEKDEV